MVAKAEDLILAGDWDGLCWETDVARTERLREERKEGWVVARRKAEENSLAVMWRRGNEERGVVDTRGGKVVVG